MRPLCLAAATCIFGASAEVLPEAFRAGAEAEECSLELRQLRARRLVEDGEATCTPIKNHGSFSSAKVLIGTPPQDFELVADTGSDAVIVQSCICKEMHACPEEFGKCFRGTGRSSTFSINATEASANSFVMSFGSGDILVVKASDEVVVGDARAYMNSSLLLMVKQALKISGQFEGILGLGRPHRDRPNAVPGFMKLAGIHRFSMCFNDQGPGVLGLNVPKFSPGLASVGSAHWGLDFRGITVGSSSVPLSFCQNKTAGMEAACGLIPDSGTTLITGPEDAISLLYQGLCTQWPRCTEMHQALEIEYEKLRKLQGPQRKRKGAARMKAMLEAGRPLHKTAEMLEDQVDEGSVPLGMADKDMTTGDSDLPASRGASVMSMETTFLLLMRHCYSWLSDNSTDLSGELPSLSFHVSGTKGYNETLKLDANSYVFVTTEPIAHKETENFLGYLPVEVISVTYEHVCMPAFSVLEYNTLKHGPVWIMGTPLFYSYQVQYDREPEPPTMHFIEGGCGTCVDGKQQSHTKLLQKKGTQGLRKLLTPPVVRHIDPAVAF